MWLQNHDFLAGKNVLENFLAGKNVMEEFHDGNDYQKMKQVHDNPDIYALMFHANDDDHDEMSDSHDAFQKNQIYERYVQLYDLLLRRMGNLDFLLFLPHRRLRYPPYHKSDHLSFYECLFFL